MVEEECCEKLTCAELGHQSVAKEEPEPAVSCEEQDGIVDASIRGGGEVDLGRPTDTLIATPLEATGRPTATPDARMLACRGRWNRPRE